jgi:hypothetical protein
MPANYRKFPKVGDMFSVNKCPVKITKRWGDFFFQVEETNSQKQKKRKKILPIWQLEGWI